jgi:hypothetical protein
MVPGNTELEAGGLVGKPESLTGGRLAIAPSGRSGLVALTGLVPSPPPEPQAVKLRARMNPKTQLKGLEGRRGFFMAMACAFQGEVKTEDPKSLRKSTHCAAIEQNPACDFLTPALENVTFATR